MNVKYLVNQLEFAITLGRDNVLFVLINASFHGDDSIPLKPTWNKNVHALRKWPGDPLKPTLASKEASGRNDNPTVSHCLGNASARRIQKSVAMIPVRDQEY